MDSFQKTMRTLRIAKRSFYVYAKASSEKAKISDGLDHFLGYQDKAFNAGDITRRIMNKSVEGEDVRKIAKASLRYGPKTYKKIKAYIKKGKEE